MTDWGQSLALVTDLRREISRLRQVTARLQADRTASLEALARVAVLLEQEARRSQCSRSSERQRGPEHGRTVEPGAGPRHGRARPSTGIRRVPE